MAPHSSTLAWKIPWTEEHGGLQSMGSLRVGHDWATSLSLFTFMHWRKWQPTPVFLPGESQRWGSLVGCHPWGRPESDMTEVTSVQFSSVAQSCLTLCDPMDCSTPGLPVIHHLLEFVQTHVHWVGDVIQPSHHRSFPSPPTFNLSQHQGLFQTRGPSIGASASASVLLMNIQAWFPLGWTGLIFLSKGLSRVFSRTSIWKHQFFGAQPSLWSNSHIRIWLLEKSLLWLYGPLSAKWCPCFLT